MVAVVVVRASGCRRGLLLLDPALREIQLRDTHLLVVPDSSVVVLVLVMSISSGSSSRRRLLLLGIQELVLVSVVKLVSVLRSYY